MAVVEVRLPQWGMNMLEGTVTEWLVGPGDRVDEDQPIANVETAKVEGEVVAPATGVVEEIVVKADETVSVRTILARIREE